MIKRTITTFDIKHTGDEMYRLEIMGALNAMSQLINSAHLAYVMFESVKSDLISVTIEEVEVNG